MRILLLTTHLNIGGISTYTVSLARALKAKGESVFVASGGGVLVSELTAAGISHIKVDIFTKSELSPKVFRAVFEVIGITKALDIEVIHAQTRVSQVVGFFVSRLRGIPFITTCHGFFRRNIGRILLPAWGKRVIAISEAVQAHLEKDFKVPYSRISLIHNGIEVKKFVKDLSDKEKDGLKDKFGIKRKCAVIGTIARFTPDKGHDVILRAFSYMLKENPDIQLIFVGEGRERSRIMELAGRMNLSQKVLFLKSQINTANILSVMDVFIFAPKRKEGLGLVLLEALASGKGVVATNVGGISSVIKNGINGFMVEPSRPELLVEPVMRLLKDRELYRKMSCAGKETAIEKFSINGMADKVQDVYKQVMS